MKTFEEWEQTNNTLNQGERYTPKTMYEAGQANAIDLTEDEWEECERWITTYDHLINMIPIDPEDKVDIIHSKLIRQALELRERQK